VWFQRGWILFQKNIARNGNQEINLIEYGNLDMKVNSNIYWNNQKQKRELYVMENESNLWYKRKGTIKNKQD